jgi:hypothetical protein
MLVHSRCQFLEPHEPVDQIALYGMSGIPTSHPVFEEVNRVSQCSLSVSLTPLQVELLTKHFSARLVPGSRIATKAHTAPAWKVCGVNPVHVIWQI